MWREEPTSHLRWHYGVLQQKWVIETLEERHDASLRKPILWVTDSREEWRDVPTEGTGDA